MRATAADYRRLLEETPRWQWLTRWDLKERAKAAEARELEDRLNAEGTSYAEVLDEAARDQGGPR